MQSLADAASVGGEKKDCAMGSFLGRTCRRKEGRNKHK